MECHDPHAANQEYVLKQPVRDLCLGCHVAKPGQTAQQTIQGRALPPDWVADSNDPGPQYLKLSSKHVHAPAKESCLICHDAHASDFARELRVPVRDLCMDCHGPNSEKIVQSNQPFPLFNGLVSLPPKAFEKLPRFELSGKYVHEPVNISCAFCHDAHASDYAAELYAPVQDVCLACHGSSAVRMYQTDQPYPLFGGRVILPPKPFQNLKILNLIDGRLGHPTSRHPVSGPATENSPEFTCATCHSPHSASTGPKLLVSEKDVLCYSRCHKLE
jgi:predicted CXXCH cytochrome family protein